MKKYCVSALVACVLLAGVAWVTADAPAKLGQSVFDQIDLLVDVRHEIVSNYVEKPDQPRMVEDAVRAMVNSLDDRYTVFLTAEELEPFDKQVRGTFSGIGAEIDLFNNRLRIVSPLEESPAWHSGVMAGDIVLEIEGKSTEGITIVDAVNKLTGPEGTQVTISVRHPSGEEQVITITRARINVQTVRGFLRDQDNHWDYMLDPTNGVGYIRITQFTGSTAEGVQQALDRLFAQNARAVILDMRFNPGGMLDAAVEVSDYFLESGQRIVSVKGRNVAEHVYTATDKDTVEPIPLIVLANEASASAAEIVTGALSDNQRAQFIGTRTFGKGSVQQVRMLANGQGALKITHAYYYLPNGRNIHRREGKDEWGVDPAEGSYVPMTPEQIKKMVEIRRESPLLRAAEPDALRPTVTPEWIESEQADPQLAAALRAAIGKLETGQWPVVGESGADTLIRETQRAGLVLQRDLLKERLELVEEEIAKLDTPSDEQEESDEEPLAMEEETEHEDTTEPQVSPLTLPAELEPVAP